jgi:hypothetical protein
LAEITEYALAAMVSALLVGGSVATYAAFERFESSSVGAASLSTLVALGDEAIERGRSSSIVFFPPSTVACSGGSLTLAYGNTTVGAVLPTQCDFSIFISGGPHTLTFLSRSSVLYMQVN